MSHFFHFGFLSLEIDSVNKKIYSFPPAQVPFHFGFLSLEIDSVNKKIYSFPPAQVPKHYPKETEKNSTFSRMQFLRVNYWLGAMVISFEIKQLLSIRINLR